jgi:hypothetical protein
MVIAIDFDGTCVSHRFPEIGKDIGAIPVLKELVAKGHKLILWTIRADREILGNTQNEFIIDAKGTFLTDAVNWFKENDIPLYGIQKNPTQTNWTTSPKCYAEKYIDDCNMGTPLIKLDEEEKPFVNWYEMRKLLIGEGIL